jgi:hypothetical protein
VKNKADFEFRSKRLNGGKGQSGTEKKSRSSKEESYAGQVADNRGDGRQSPKCFFDGSVRRCFGPTFVFKRVDRSISAFEDGKTVFNAGIALILGGPEEQMVFFV